MLNREKSCSVILAAGGSGSRFGGEINKILLPLRGKPVIAHSLEVFLEHPAVREIVIPCREEDRKRLEEIVRAEGAGEKGRPPVTLVRGGQTRRESVYTALQSCREELVLIHDAARPFVEPWAVDECLEALGTFPAVSLAVQSKDTVKIVNEMNVVISTTERSRTYLIQTPQGFYRVLLRQAHEAFPEAGVTDDCSLMELAGYPVRLVEGSYRNFKITTPEDMPDAH